MNGPRPRTLSRRRFLVSGAAAVTAAVGLDAFTIEPGRVVVSRHDVPVPNLPAGLDGICIAQLTDVHLPANRAAAIAALEALARERPDAVVCTGDLCESVEAAGDLFAFLERVRPFGATAATLGNWEYRAGLAGEVGRQLYADLGIPLLVNAHAIVRIRRTPLVIVGIDTLSHGQPDVRAALAGAPTDLPHLWLTHAPGLIEQLPRDLPVRPFLTLSGHTHGGQIRLPGLPAYTPEGSGRFVEGWYRDTTVPLYVSRGIGTAEIRARFLCPPELPIFTLRRA